MVNRVTPCVLTLQTIPRLIREVPAKVNKEKPLGIDGCNLLFVKEKSKEKKVMPVRKKSSGSWHLLFLGGNHNLPRCFLEIIIFTANNKDPENVD
jgi:hypothetical protein